MLKRPYHYLMLLSLFAAALFAEEPAAAVEPAVPEAPEILDLPESELIEITGYLTAHGGGLGTLSLSESEVESAADGFVSGLKGEVNIMEYPREAMEAAFGQAQARAEAVAAESEELPEITEDALKKIGLVMAMQSGLTQMGFGEAEAADLRKGFIVGAQATEMDPELEAKLPTFQQWIQPRVQKAQAAAMMEQQKAMEAQQKALEAKQAALKAEFEPIAVEWKEKEPMTVVLETTQGEIEIELMPAVAPIAVANFVQHVEAGYYDGLIFHRIIPDFMIQGGDPQGTGMGGESIWGKSFPDEFSDEVTFDTEGLLAMANSGPMTNGSQFFITTSQPTWLNGKHTIFGKVTSGYDVVEKLEGVETGEADKPVETQKIVKAHIK